MFIKKAMEQAHAYMKACIVSGDVVVDATMGNGYDTVQLAQLVGENGRVIGFDIQQEAVERTSNRLLDAGLLDRCTLIHEGHEKMQHHIVEQIKLVLFNLGYLPGGTHGLFTRAETTIIAIESAMILLQDNGVILIVVYHGGDSGYEERDALLQWVTTIDARNWRVQIQRIINWPNDPPFLIVIEKDR